MNEKEKETFDKLQRDVAIISDRSGIQQRVIERLESLNATFRTLTTLGVVFGLGGLISMYLSLFSYPKVLAEQLRIFNRPVRLITPRDANYVIESKGDGPVNSVKRSDADKLYQTFLIQPAD